MLKVRGCQLTLTYLAGVFGYAANNLQTHKRKLLALLSQFVVTGHRVLPLTYLLKFSGRVW